MTITTTLNKIRNGSPCEDGWIKLLKHLGKTKSDDEPIDLLTVIDSNGLDDALWVLENATEGTEFLRRLLAADYAERVLHLFEEENPNNKRPREAIAVARNPDATPDELAAERAAAGVAARGAAGAAERDAERAAAWDAAWAAARAAAGDAERAAERAAAGAAAGDAERAAQDARLRQYIEHGIDAAKMEWPKS